MCSKLFSFMLLALWPLVLNGQYIGVEMAPPPAVKDALVDLVVNHPKAEIRETLQSWIGQRKVYLSSVATYPPPEMTVELTQLRGAPTPILIVNPEFLFKPVSYNLKDDRGYKELVLYHQYVILKNHFEGKIRLLSAAFSEAQIPARARHIWEKEFAAAKETWLVARELNIEHLISPKMTAALKEHGEELGFVEGFHKAMVIHYPPNQQLFQAEWDKVYRQEREKIARRK